MDILNIRDKRAQKRAGIRLFGCRRFELGCVLLLLGTLVSGGFGAARLPSGSLRFVILGDRTGEAVPGAYQQAWREAAADRPDFVITVGDTIQGGDDRLLARQWQEAIRIFAPYHRSRIFLTPGNHDVWSAASARAYQLYSRHPLHYSFDYKQAHFTILDNSRTDELPAAELEFLRQDLEAHRASSPKFIFSHRPSWLLSVALGNTRSPLHQIAKQYGVQYVIAGHIHQMLAFQLDGVHYFSMPSAGGHLRASRRYEDGWFFAHSLVTVNGTSVQIEIKELRAPFGSGRLTRPAAWGAAGLLQDLLTK